MAVAATSEWAPSTRPPSGCVCTILTSNLMDLHSWGAAAIEIARNWAIAHGYRYVRFSETSRYNTSVRLPHSVELAVENNKAARFWLKPQAMLSLLERGAAACPWVFYLDGDAIVNDVRKQVDAEILTPYLAHAPHVHLLLNCHSPFGVGGNCNSCRCCRAGQCEAAERARLPQADGSWINAGVVFIRNSAEAREMVRWWASAGYGECATEAGSSGRGSSGQHRHNITHSVHDPHGHARVRSHAHRASEHGHAHGGRGVGGLMLLAEQECAQRMQRAWPGRVDVLNARVFNTPLWYEPTAYQWFEVGRHRHNDVIRDVITAAGGHGRSRSAACVGSAMFVCHAYDAPADFRALVVSRRLAAVRPVLRAMLAVHGDNYLPFAARAPSSFALASSSGDAVAPLSTSVTRSAAAASTASSSSASAASAASTSAEATTQLSERSRRASGGGSRSTLEARGCSDPGCCLRHPRACSAPSSSLAATAAVSAARRGTPRPHTAVHGHPSPPFARATVHAVKHTTPHAAPHSHAKAREAASLAAPVRGGNCTALHIAVNSNLRYTRPRLLLLRSLRAAGVPMAQVHVFIGGAFNGPPAGYDPSNSSSVPPTAEESVADGLRYHYVPHDSMDFSGLIAIAEAPRGAFGPVRQWFYMHDTTAVGPGFWGAISRWCPRLPACAMPLTCRWPSSSMGLYDAAFLASERAKTLARVKNRANLSSNTFKRQALQDEDALLKACQVQTGHGCHDVRHGPGRDACYSSAAGRHICVCNKVAVDGEPRAVYGPGSAPRQFARFPCADLTKFKANYGQHGMPYTGGDATKYVLNP